MKLEAGARMDHLRTCAAFASILINNLAPKQRTSLRYTSHIEAPFHHIPVLHDIFLALNAELALFPALRVGAEFGEIMERHDFTCDESALKVTVNDSRGLRRLHSLRDGPRTRLLLARGQVGL